MKSLATLSSFVLVLLTTCAMASPTHAQSQSTLLERLNFLKGKLEKHLTHSIRAAEGPESGHTTLEAVSFETCRIVWSISSEFGQNTDVPTGLGDVKMSNHVSVDLSSIDPARTRIYVVEEMERRGIPWSLVLELRTRPGRPGFNLQMVTTKGGRITRMPTVEEKHYAFFFNINDQLVVEDVSKAFHEAGNICRSSMRRRR